MVSNAVEIIFNKPNGDQEYLQCEIIGNVVRPITGQIVDAATTGWRPALRDELAQLAKLATDSFEDLEWNDSRSAAFLEVTSGEG